MVLQYEVLGIGPVVRNVALGVIPHDIGSRREGTDRVRIVLASAGAGLSLTDEAIHLVAVDVASSVELSMRSAAVDVGVINIWSDTGVALRIGDTPVSYTHLRAHETVLDLVCRLLLE